jgi:predicted Zn-dependent protease
MKSFKNFRLFNFSILTLFLFRLGLLLIPLSTSCSASLVREMDQTDTLKILRDLTKDGKLPSESLVLDIEKRYAGTKSGALAKLLRARIRFENNDFAGAAEILNSNVIAEKTEIGDYALWLRGQAFEKQNNYAEAMKMFAQLANDFPNSIRTREAKILWANLAMQTGQASKVPAFLGDLNAKHNADSLLMTAKSYEQQGNQADVIKFYREVYFYGAGTDAAKEAEANLTALGQDLTPRTEEEITARGETLYNAKNYSRAIEAIENLLKTFPTANNPQLQLKRLTAYSALRRMNEAQFAFNAIPPNAKEKPEAYYQLATGYVT